MFWPNSRLSNLPFNESNFGAKSAFSRNQIRFISFMKIKARAEILQYSFDLTESKSQEKVIQNSIVMMDVDSVQEMIREAYRHQKHSKCIELIDAAPASVRNSSQYKILKASCLNNMAGNAEAAHDVLDEVIKSNPKNAFAFYGKGLVFINESKHSEAVKCFEEAIAIDPSEKMIKARQMKERTESMMKTSKIKKKLAASLSQGTKHCIYCKKDFAKSFSLSRHILLHTGEKPHKCPICNYGFIQKSDLRRHLATHSKAFNFKCAECGKPFKTKKNLHCHLSTHSKIRPYKCNFCPKDFKLPRLLKHHEENYHKGNRFNCKTCSKQFPSKFGLTRHNKNCGENAAVGKRGIEAVESPRHEKVEVEELHDVAMHEAEIVDAKAERKKKLIGELNDDNEKDLSRTEPSHSMDEDSLLVEIKSEIFIEPPEIKPVAAIKTVRMKSEFKHEQSSTIKSEELTFGDINCDVDDGSDLAFVMSLLRDISKMSEDQKACFKTRTLATIDDILM